MEGLRLSRFAEHFLPRAPRPKGWTCIAPGIGTFSEASLRETYSAEPEDAFRRTSTTSEEGEDWVTLVLPSVGRSVPAEVSRVLDLDISSFDNSYGGRLRWGGGLGCPSRGRMSGMGIWCSWCARLGGRRLGSLVGLVPEDLVGCRGWLRCWVIGRAWSRTGSGLWVRMGWRRMLGGSILMWNWEI